ncbi:hypothetical protein KQ693_01790 [Thermus sp. PS18]|uniref:hypothetical protein n=1 Tax=Thermus sp. PS18 TaxID=2849039 RepID=UPI00226517F3|nr:hypothetical protein [Thermus sp. PS18]UZX15802.1 hypothetical protein KQ693_01790 [Thermus sp. PS18]
MKGNRLKTLGFALVGGLALLFAGCGQQVQTPPPPGTPTTVAVEGLYNANTSIPVDPNNVSGLVIVRAKVVLGSVVPDKVQFLLDNNVEYEVNFGAATQGIRPQQATYTFEWNLNTAALANLAPKYPNGAHTVQVRLVKGGNPVATSTATSVKFNNSDFAVLKISGNALNKGGKRYYGGGPVTLEVVPVLYSGKGVQSVELDLSGVGGGVDLDASTSGVQSTATLTSAPYVFTIPYNSTNKNSSLDGAALGAMLVTVTYADTTSLSVPPSAVLDGSQVLVDSTGLFSNNPPFALSTLRLDFYVPTIGTGALVCKATTSLGPGQFATSGNLLVGFSSYTPDAGVGGDQIVVDVNTTTNTPVLTGQAVSITGGGCAGAGALAGLPEGGFFQVYVKAVKDALGNTYTYSTPPASNAFGIDNTKPTLALSTGYDNRAYFNSASLNTGNVSGKDLNGNSVGTTIVGWLTVNDPASGTPPVASGINTSGYIWKVNGQTITAVTTNTIPGLNDIAATLGSAPQGYYTLTVQATDNAGNVSDPVTLNVLYDNTAPNVVFTQPTVTALTGGTSFTATAHATDNVDLRQGLIYWSKGTIRFTALTSTPKAFGAPGVTSADYTGTLTALKPSTGGDFTLFAWVQDMARNAPATSTLAISVTPANANTAGTLGGFSEVPDINQASGGSTTLTFTHTGGTAQVKAVHVYLWSSNDGTNDYYNYVADATPIGGGQYAVVFSAPANLSTPQVLVVVEYDNGLAIGYTYNYGTNTPTPVF